ncbi:MAG: ATP-binding protein [Anaerolineales bacterium]
MMANIPPIKVAVASGKGGTGKTTIATSLALSLSQNISDSILFLDCDVEAPNAHLFLRPQFEAERPVEILIPEVDEAACTHCGKCAEVCQFQAIAVLGKKTLVFPQLCHGCGSCTLVCPTQAIHEVPKQIGILQQGTSANMRFARGVMNIGEPMAVPIIRQLKKWVSPLKPQVTIVDSPPGTSCPVVESIRSNNFLILVTEPTPFGLHDLRLAYSVAQDLQIPAGVVINRDNGAFKELEDFCESENIPILMRIPFQREIAEGISQGKNLIEVLPDMKENFLQSFETIKKMVKK